MTVYDYDRHAALRHGLRTNKRSLIAEALEVAELAERRGFVLLAGRALDLATGWEGESLAYFERRSPREALVALDRELAELERAWRLANRDARDGVRPAAFEAAMA